VCPNVTDMMIVDIMKMLKQDNAYNVIQIVLHVMGQIQINVLHAIICNKMLKMNSHFLIKQMFV